MKKSKLPWCKFCIVGSIGILLYFYGCKVEENKPPTCTIVTPEDESNYSLGATITVTVNADDVDGSINEVRFEVDGVAVKIDNELPYDYEWSTTGLELGSHTVKAMATDNDGASSSDEAMIELILETGTVTDFDGNVYTTVKIGEQWWMAENLKTTHYADGTPLVDGTDEDYIWSSDTNKYYFAYNNDDSHVSTFGRLYTWNAVMNGAISSVSNPSGVQGIAPAGWHIPSDAEWKELEKFLGMTQSEADDDRWRGTNEGGKLKEAGTSIWISPNEGATNEGGFSALPGGMRDYDGDFLYLYYSSYFWSTSEYGDEYAWYRLLSYDSSEIYRNTKGATSGLAVRCVKD